MDRKFLCFIACLIILCTKLNAKETKGSEWLQKMIPDNYSSNDSPTKSLTDGNVTEDMIVYCSVIPKYIKAISMKTMDFSADLIVIVEWHDERLTPQKPNAKDSPVSLPPLVAEMIWHPWIYLKNCIDSDCRLISPGHDAPGGHVVMTTLWFDNSKVGFRVENRKTYNFPCDLQLAAYPFDRQRCVINITWLHKISEPISLVLETVNNNSDKRDIGFPPEFRMHSYSVQTCPNGSHYGVPEQCKSLVFEFQRIYAQHLMLIFLPCMLIVILSWLSFWLDAGSPAPRVALGLTSLLTLATQFNVAQKDLPPIATVKAIDIWMFTCIFLVFFSLIEYWVANLFHRITPTCGKQTSADCRCLSTSVQPLQVKPSRMPKGKNGNVTVAKTHAIPRRRWHHLRRGKTTSKVDYVARIIFPVAFLIFNMVFWILFWPA